MNLGKHTWVIALAVVSALTTTVSVTAAQGVQKGARTIRGVWRTAVTPYNCQTGQPIVTLSGLFTFYRYDSSGVLLGSQKVTAALELGGDGDSFASRSQIEILDVNNNVVGMGCANTVGRRFE